VTFTVNGAPIGDPVPLAADGTATSAPQSLTPGMYRVKAAYSGDANFVDSSDTLQQQSGQGVVKGASSTALGVSPNPADYGKPVTLTATVSAVSPASGTPSGVVSFHDADTLLGSAGLTPAGDGTAHATLTTSSLRPGSHPITASYAGSYNFMPSSDSASLTVGLTATATGLSSSPNPSVYSQPVTFTATVTADPASAGLPPGSVTFTDGYDVLGSASLQTVGGQQQASITVSDFDAGQHTIQASYGGAGDYAASTSEPLTQVVQRAPTAVAAEPVAGNGGKVQATLTSEGAPLAGQTIDFATLRGRHLCTATTNTDGVASCHIGLLQRLAIRRAGGYGARFTGAPNYAPASGTAS
jgi:hypothetical protein